MNGPERARAVLAFGLGAELYALDLGGVRSVRRDLPRTEAAGLDGVVVAEGERLPLVDLRRRFGLPVASGRARLLVVEHPEAGPLALRVDQVAGVERVLETDVLPVPRYFEGPAAACMAGVAHVGERLLILLELGTLLTAEQCAAARRVHEEVPAEGKGAR